MVVVPLPFGTAVTIAAMLLKFASFETSKRYTTVDVPEIAPFVTLNSGLLVVILPEGVVATGALMTTGFTTLKLDTDE